MVYSPGKEMIFFDCNASWNPKNAGLDLISVVNFGLLDLRTVAIYDTETDRGTPLERDIVFVPTDAFREGEGTCLIVNGYEGRGIVDRQPFSSFAMGYTGKEITGRLFS